MVVKHSEYQKQFGRSVHRINVPSYTEKVAYRNRRRAQEMAHTPISWDTAEDLSDDSLLEEERELKRRAQRCSSGDAQGEETEDESDEDVKADEETDSLPDLKACHSLEPEKGLEDALAPRPSAKVIGVSVDGDKLKTYKIVKKKLNTDKKEAEEGRRELRNRTVVLKKSRSKEGAPKKSCSRTEVKMVPCSCSKKAPPPRPVSAPPDRPEEPGPFMNYGWADREREMGKLRTFNTKTASKDHVYESALRALRQRMVAWEKRLKQKQRSREERSDRCRSAAATPRESDQWASSYRQDYALYDGAIYRRNRMALKILPHVSHFDPKP